MTQIKIIEAQNYAALQTNVNDFIRQSTHVIAEVTDIKFEVKDVRNAAGNTHFAFVIFTLKK